MKKGLIENNNRFIQTIEIKDLFKYCCFHDRPKVYLRALRIYGNNMQLKANSYFVENNTIIKKVCGWCEKEITENDFDYFAGYWTGHSWRPVHKDCKKEYKDTEVKDCQKIDADCNDCKHFERIRSLGTGIASGNCKKFKKETIAYVNYSRGMKCFEHRKD